MSNGSMHEPQPEGGETGSCLARRSVRIGGQLGDGGGVDGGAEGVVVVTAVAAVGECMVELRHVGPTELVLGSAGDTYNTAVYLTRSADDDVVVEYVTALGTDPYSDMIIADISAQGVAADNVVRIPDQLPGLYIIRTDDAGERSFFYYRSASAARRLFDDPHADEVARRLADNDLVYLSGITLSILDANARGRLFAALDAARARGGRVAFDANYRPAGWANPTEARKVMSQMLQRVDIALTGIADETALVPSDDPAAIVARLHAQGVGEVVLKMGAEGCLASGGRGQVKRVPAETADVVVDTTAAGDAFNGAYLAARLAEHTVEAAARAGNDLARQVIAHPGAIMPAPPSSSKSSATAAG